MIKRHMSLGFFAVCIIVFIMLLLRGHTIPDETSVRQQLEENRSDIDIITDYLINSGYTNVYIQNASGMIVADQENVYIIDSVVFDAINRVLDNYILINKLGNTIYLLQWRTAQDIGCGVAYTINGIDAPEIEFATKLVPLSDEGWYYYVSDYNAWRNSQ